MAPGMDSGLFVKLSAYPPVVVAWIDDEGEPVRTAARARAGGGDEAETPFFEYVERSNVQARRYMHALSVERGEEVKPRLSPVWTFLLATRLPFLTATIVPILLGIAAAAREGHFGWGLGLFALGGGGGAPH